MRIKRRFGLAAIPALLLLSACAPTAGAHHGPNPKPTHAVSTTSTAASNVVAVITAKAHNDIGQAVNLRLEIDAPRPITAEDKSLLHAAQCDQLPVIANRGSLPLKLSTSTATGWSTEYLTFVRAQLPEGQVAWTGAWRTFQAYCADGLAVVPGSAVGIIPFDQSLPADQVGSWGGGSYGFAESIDVEGDIAHNVTISNCHIVLGSAAHLSAKISALTDRDATKGCLFNDLDK